jgi:subtilisin family serine protease
MKKKNMLVSHIKATIRGEQPGKASVLLLLFALLPSAPAQRAVAPSGPAVAPLIAHRYPNDMDGDRIDDALLDRATKAAARFSAAITADQKSMATALLNEMVDVELIFKEPVNQQQIDSFSALGGEISYLYKAVSYGWNGRIPLGKVSTIPAAMGASLVLLNESHGMKADLDEATGAVRARAVWAPGFATSPGGYSGTTNITIAFIDSGLDETHVDFAGRGVYWADFTTDGSGSPVDYDGHGSHVAGIALGTGAAAGISGPLLFSYHDDDYRGGNPAPAGSIVPNLFHLPTNTATFSMTAQWLGGGTTELRRYFHTNGTLNWAFSATTSGPSPLTLTASAAFAQNRAWTPGLLSVGGPSVSNFVITCYVSNYPAIDSFNRLRGVAPGCNWAAAKTITADGIGNTSWTSAAIDDLVASRVEKHIKIINISQTVNSITDLALRQKVNAAANNGILVVTGTGNGGKNSTEFDRSARDPSRAALALTVSAANDVNQLTDYTSSGIVPTDGQEDDFKPDIMTPGGSDYYSDILSVDSNNNDGPGFPDQRPNDYTGMKGTSMAVPFASGCAALVIDALERNGLQWDFNSSQNPRLVKMVLCATASESNIIREGNTNNPTLQRASCFTNGLDIFPPGKDIYEGYGMINADAAVEAVSLTYTNGTVATNTLGAAVSSRRVWARTVNLTGNQLFTASLTVPATGDFDLYLYDAQPTATGTPQLLAASAQSGNGVSEALAFGPATNGTALLVVKRVSGSGSFSLSATQLPPPMLSVTSSAPNTFAFSFASLSGRTYLVQYTDSLDAPAWQLLQTINGDGSTKLVNDALSSGQRFYRVVMQ